MTAARIYHLADYRPTDTRPGIAGKATPAGLLTRVTHSPAARDLRANALAIGLLIAVAFVLIWSLS